MSTLEETPPAAVCHVEPARRIPWWVEALGLLLAPGVVALLLRLTPMSIGLQTRWTMVDPNFSTAYARHGADLLARFGPSDYFWVRVGQVLPAHLAQLAFGDVGGYVVLRYVFALLATVPAYLWLRRRSLPAGALAVAVILTSPVVLMAWGSDYPDGAALAYLLAGLPLLVFWTTGVRRLLVRGLAGVFLGLAVHAHPAAVPLVIAALVALATSAYSRHSGVRRARIRRVATEIAAVVVGLAVATGLAVLGALVLYGRADIVTPTLDQLARLQRPEEIRQWHSGTWTWAQRATYLLVPPAVVIAWSWLCRRRRRLLGEWPPRGDAIVVLATGLGYLVFLAIQATDGFTLEYYFYSSLLWAGTCLTTALLLSTLSSSWWPVAAVLGLAVLQVEIGTPRFEVVPTGLAIALVVVVAAAVVGGPRRRSVPMLVVTVGLVLLTTGQPSVAYGPEQVHYPLADYGEVGGHPDWSRVSAYATAASVVDVVPRAPVPALAWVEAPVASPASGAALDDVPSRAAAQYLGPLHGLRSPMPDLSDADRAALDAAPHGQVILLGARGDEFAAAEAALAPWAPVVESAAVLGGGTLHVLVLRLGR